MHRPEGEDHETRLSRLADEYDLTQREKEVLDLLSVGLANDEIASRLFISSNTVKFHIKNIFIKIDVPNRIQAL